MKAAPIGDEQVAQLLAKVARAVPQGPARKLPKRADQVPEEEQLCGPYGPRFVGYGPVPKTPLLQRLMPYALVLAVAAGALAIELATGKI